MGRYLTDHQEHLKIEVLDDPGAGGDCHDYRVSGGIGGLPLCIRFQDGPIGEAGANGVTQESLIAICIDRLRGFQQGDYACRENALALTKLEETLHWLQHRTRDRMARGVEGTNEV